MAIDKAKLKAAFAEIEKAHGPGTVFTLGGARKLNVEVIPTTVLAIDKATGVGGIPRGRITEIFGPYSGGKTTLTLMAIAQAQKAGGVAAFIDAEHALDPGYAKALGVDVDNLIVSQPDNGEQALEVADSLIRSGQCSIVVVDSVAALVPKKELEGEMGDAQMGSQGRLMSQAMRKLNASVARTATALVFINQLRFKVGVMFGNPETTPGGEALKFYASLRITVRPSTKIKQGDQEIGALTNIKIVKNKVAAPFKTAEVDQLFGLGFDPITNNLNTFLELGIATKSGSRILFENEEIANGKENAVETLRLDQGTYSTMYDAARAKLWPAPVAQKEAEESESE